jgi:hypothetical protein
MRMEMEMKIAISTSIIVPSVPEQRLGRSSLQSRYETNLAPSNCVKHYSANLLMSVILPTDIIRSRNLLDSNYPKTGSASASVSVSVLFLIITSNGIMAAIW